MRLTLLRLLIAGLTAATLGSAMTIPASTTYAADKKPSRQKVIDFEDELVEGMNKRPLDSLSQISEREKRKRKQHLYRKRVGFRAETGESIHELRYVQ